MDIIENVEITTKDIQAKFTRGESADNRIRKSWVIQMPEAMLEKLRALPGSTQLNLCKTFDSEVNDLYVAALKSHRENAEANGAKYVRIDGFRRLEDDACVDIDQVLLDVAKQWVDKFVAENLN